MAKSFGDLPAELVHAIVDHLGLPEIRALRLASHQVKPKVTGSPRFENFCSKKQVDLSVSSLEQTAARLSSLTFECPLEHLTATGVLYVTEGLERIMREKTKPTDLEDPCAVRSDDIGNSKNSNRIPATQDDLADAESQLLEFKQNIREAEEERATGRDLDALAALLNLIRTSCKPKRLRTLALDVNIYREKSTALPPAVGTTWRRVWEKAEHVFSTSILAWKRSGITIEQLDVFSDIEACSVQSYAVARLLDRIDTWTVRGLKALSLSVSNAALPADNSRRVQDADPDDLWAQQINGVGQRHRGPPQAQEAYRAHRREIANQPINFTGPAEWLQRLSLDLEGFHLRDYLVTNDFDTDSPSTSRGRAIMKQIAQRAPLPRLKKLTLRGFNIDLDSLMTILRNSPALESITLQDVTLYSSSNDGHGWSTVFAHLTAPSSALSYIYLDNLFQDLPETHEYIACYTPGLSPGDSISDAEDGGKASMREELQAASSQGSWDFCRPGAKGHNAFQLKCREHVLRGIEYVTNPHYVVGSVQNSMWMGQRARLYGPPGRL
jgi:hypothetical protein